MPATVSRYAAAINWGHIATGVSKRIIPLIGVSLLVIPLMTDVPESAASQPPSGETASRFSGVEVEVKCTDGSILRVRVLDEKLELATRYGTLQVPTAEVRRIEFAHRCPPAEAEKIALAISRLGHPDYRIREQATEELQGYRERAYPFLLRALKNSQPEVNRRLEEIVRHIQSQVPAAQLENREYDVVVTADSKIVGRLTATALRVQTAQFGEQMLRLSDMHLLSVGSSAAEAVAEAPAAPTNLMAFQHQFGKEMTYTVTGFVPGTGQANVWGTDIYTLDSHVAAAAVHAGIVQPGKTAVVRVRIVQSPPQFISSYRNGINSTAYGHYPAGAYEFVRK